MYFLNLTPPFFQVIDAVQVVVQEEEAETNRIFHQHAEQQSVGISDQHPQEEVRRHRL